MPTVAAGNVAAHNLTLVANVVTTVDFADSINRVSIYSDGTSAVYFTLDGSTPTVAGANCYLIPAGTVGVEERSVGQNKVTIKLISAGTPTVSVVRD